MQCALFIPGIFLKGGEFPPPLRELMHSSRRPSRNWGLLLRGGTEEGGSTSKGDGREERGERWEGKGGE